MRMAIRGTATATALALVWAAAVAAPPGVTKAQNAADAAPAVTPAPAPSPAATNAPAATAKITGTAFAEDADGARVVLSANAPLLYTSYEPRPNLLVVDLRDASVASNVATPKVGGLVESIKFEELDELGKRITRLSITHNPDAHPDLAVGGPGAGDRVHGPDGKAEAADAPAEACDRCGRTGRGIGAVAGRCRAGRRPARAGRAQAGPGVTSPAAKRPTPSRA